MFESCQEVRSYFGEFLEGECSRDEFRTVQYHLSHCEACRRRLDRERMLGEDLHSLPRPQVPPEVALRLQVRMSQALHRNLLGRLRVRFENFLRPRLLPASAGLLTAVVLVGLILGYAMPPTVSAPDVPVQLVTPPSVQMLAPVDFNVGDQGVTLVTRVDAGGRAVSYRLLSGQRSPELMHSLDRMMYYSVFKPATMFGRPTEGEVVVSLRRITVRG
jgi:Putative zinc-finger